MAMAATTDDRLCAELYDYIVDFLHDDEAALRACALVCRAWTLTSRYHLFHHLRLTGSRASPSPTRGWDPNSTACRRIWSTLLSSPHLASYVNKLSIHENTSVRSSTSSYRWVSGEITFPLLLKKLTSLRSLEFNFPVPGPSSEKIGWSTMAFRDIIDALSAMRSLEYFSLRQFSFSSLHDFIEILTTFKNMKTLQLDHVDIITTTTLFSPSALEHVLTMQLSDSMPTSHLSEEKANLETLLLRSNNVSLVLPVLLHSRSFADLSSLRRLTLNVPPDSYRLVVEFLKNVSNLEYLDLEIDHDFDYESHLDHKDTISLNLLPSLQSLSIQSSILLGRTESLPWLFALLNTAQPTNHLEDLSLTCIIDKPPPLFTQQAFNHTLNRWRDLDGLLTQHAFDRMKRVRVDFSLDNPSGDETLGQIANAFIQELTELGKKGVLEVDVCEAR